jgi:hypothetical protein
MKRKLQKRGNDTSTLPIGPRHWSSFRGCPPRQTSLHQYKLPTGKNDTTSTGFGSHTSLAKFKGSKYYYTRFQLSILISIEVKHKFI